MFMEMGARSVRAAVTHPVLSGPAYDRINKSALSEVIVTDTIPLKQSEDLSKFTVLSVADLFAECDRARARLQGDQLEIHLLRRAFGTSLTNRYEIQAKKAPKALFCLI